MKGFKKLSQNQLIGVLTLVFVVLLGLGLYMAKAPVVEEEAFDDDQTPPLVSIDTGYNATLSGEPFYIVEDEDEDDFDDSLDTCNELETDANRIENQSRWHRVVAFEDGMTVEDVIFEQIELREGDRIVAVVYDAENQNWMAWPNKIIVDVSGDNVELLDRKEVLKKGTVVAVSASRDVESCIDYEEIGDHENIELKWNLVSRPDYDAVDYRTIWEVAFGKRGDSGDDLERYYSASDPANSVSPSQLPGDELYWVYGGVATAVTPGGDLPEEETPTEEENPTETEQAIVVKVNNSVDGSNVAGQRDVVNGETFTINEKDGEVVYSVGLALPADGEVELEFEIYEDGQLVEVQNAEEIASRSPASGVGAFARGKNFSDGENTQTGFNLVAIDENLAEIPKSVEFKVVDKAGNLNDVSFKIEIIDDELTGPVCTQQLVYGVALEVKGIAGNIIEDARVVAYQADGTIVSESNGSLGGGSESFYNNGIYYLLPEAEGDFTVRVEKSGIDSEEFDVTLVKDDCHVITQTKTVTLTDEVEQNVDLTVTVRDAITGDLIIGANVIVAGTTQGATTNLDGEAVINDAPEFGRVEVSNIGYLPGSFRVSENFEGRMTVSLTPEGQVSFGPVLELLTPQIAPDGRIEISIASGYEIDALCGLDDKCTLSLGNETLTYSATNGVNSQTSPNGVIRMYIRENSTTVDFEIGEYTVVIDGATYKNGQLVPRFEETVTVQ